MALRKNKRAAFATNVGVAYGKYFVDSWNLHGTDRYPKGIVSIPEMAGSIAEVSLFSACNWAVTPEEEALAKQAAVAYCKQHLYVTSTPEVQTKTKT